MDLLRAIILGAVQGVTEFLPISSDGHLVVVDHFLPGGLGGRAALGFDILLHCGSLLAIVVGFYDVWSALLRGLVAGEKAAWRTAGFLAIATVPGVVAGLLLQELIAGELRSLTAAAIGFLVTAACLVAGETVGRFLHHRDSRVHGVSAFVIGLAQAIAILPGVSRSGLTVSAGRAFGLSRENALNFSFLMALPIILGAVAKTGLDVLQGDVTLPPLPISSAGFATSALVSMVAIFFLRRFVRGHSFAWFAWYLVPLALLLIGEDMGLRTLLDAEHARETVRAVGAIAVFAFAMIEVVPPFSFVSPGITALVIAGSITPDIGSLLVFVLAASTASFLGNSVLYAAGTFAGPSLERALRIHRHARLHAEAFIRRAGVFAVIGGQFIGPLRPTIAFVAGVLGMHPTRFFPTILVGGILWSVSALGIGYVLSDHAMVVAGVLAVVGVIVVVAFASVAYARWMRSRE